MGSQSVGHDLVTFTSLPMQGVPVQSLAGEPGSHKPQGQKSKKHKKKDYGNKFNKVLKKKAFWRRKWQPTPVFLPGERSLVGYSAWSCKRVKHNSATQQQWSHDLMSKGTPTLEPYVLQDSSLEKCTS